MERAYDVPRIEGIWREAWRRARCFEAPERLSGPKFFNYDSGPFPNGPLHMGHVRTYVLGDVTARYQRLLGKSVLYSTEFDAFGLPNELAAQQAGESPEEYARACIALQRRQLERLGISYDWSRVTTTCEPAYYRWTQRLFLTLLARGLVERREAELDWCPGCETTLARMQVEDGRCWRCARAVEKRSMLQWFVLLSRYSAQLRAGLARLDGWSARAKALLEGFIGEGSFRVHDWLVSRQRSWGTPIPIVHCGSCGAVPVPLEELPVELPLGGRVRLADCPAFVDTRCPRCGREARRETDTLDGYFDDVWCPLASLIHDSGSGRMGLEAGFDREVLNAWMPVDRFHSGFDTFLYLHLHRFLGRVLHEEGLLDDPEMIRSYLGHDMVLAAGRKMSKHLGNAVSPEDLLQRHGSDALRVAMMWAAGPQRTLEWDEQRIERAARLLDDAYRLVQRCVARAPTHAAASPEPTRTAAALTEQAARAFERVGRFVDEYRPNAAVQELAGLLGLIETFAHARLGSARLTPADARTLLETLAGFAIALSPFAPHLGEELWKLLERPPFASLARWPSPTARASGDIHHA